MRIYEVLSQELWTTPLTFSDSKVIGAVARDQFSPKHIASECLTFIHYF
jgi:hypothetical protein